MSRDALGLISCLSSPRRVAGERRHIGIDPCVEDEVAILDRDEVMAIYRREQDEQFRCVRGLW